ncbi:unnamed protein product [Clonostachys rhizophaga]|uniref:Aminotransferase class I/classII large domain-containing protein n=1 Tax=Clonostachys rhizophaga TaxID=160324 RepID=A0A9N9VYD1_9HYPO|nr:unnamed protein product [Clonostachys rhizophaga]
MYFETINKQWGEDHRLKGSSMQDEPAFYRNLEQALDVRRQSQYFLNLKPQWGKEVVDLTTSDFLAVNHSGKVRQRFLDELEQHPDFRLGANGSRLQYGNTPYINQVEKEIADFHGAETAFIVASAYAANLGVLSSVPLAGDALVYDELVHASSFEGFKLSMAMHRLPFPHNDPDGLREVLVRLKKDHPEFVAGTSSILICVESIYSMEGDVCELRELVQVAKEEFPLGNAQFVMDEAHSIGVVGDKGRGLVSYLGMEDDIAIRVHSVSKALGSTGGVIMCKKTVRSMMLNNARSLTFTCAPSFPTVCSVRASYQLLISGALQEAQEKLQSNIKRFLTALTENPVWDEAVDEGILSIPTLEDWERRPFQTQIVPLFTRERHETYLFFHLLMRNFNAYPYQSPVVPKGKSRVRIVLHAYNTDEQIDELASTICDWASEVLDIDSGKVEAGLPTAARQAYAMQRALQS